MARLHKKTDESLQKYLCAFAAMCRRVCRLPPKEGGQTSICLFINYYSQHGFWLPKLGYIVSHVSSNNFKRKKTNKLAQPYCGSGADELIRLIIYGKISGVKFILQTDLWFVLVKQLQFPLDYCSHTPNSLSSSQTLW